MSADIFKKGSVDLLVLHLLSKEDAYGYQLVHRIEETSKGLLSVQLASLYPVLYRLTDEAYISCKETYAEKGKGPRTGRSPRIRVIYHIEEAGRVRLKELLDEHKMLLQGFINVLSFGEEGEYHE